MDVTMWEPAPFPGFEYYQYVNPGERRSEPVALESASYKEKAKLLWHYDVQYFSNKTQSMAKTKRYILCRVDAMVAYHRKHLCEGPPSFYELVKLDAPVKLFLDIDGKEVDQTCEERLKKVIEMMLRCIATTFPGLSGEQEYVMLDASSDTRFSRHIIFQTISFPNMAQLIAFMSTFRCFCDETLLQNFVDFSVYKNHQAFRLLYSVTLGNSRVLKWMNKNGSIEDGSSFNEDHFKLSLITTPDPSTIIRYEVTPQSRTTVGQHSSSSSANNRRDENAGFFVDRCKGYVESNWDQVPQATKATIQYTYEGYNETYKVYQVRLTPTRGFPISCRFGETHTSNTHMIKLDKGGRILSYHCFRCDKEKKLIRKRGRTSNSSSSNTTSDVVKSIFTESGDVNKEYIGLLQEEFKETLAKETVNVGKLDAVAYECAFEEIHVGVPERVHDEYANQRNTRRQMEHIAQYMTINQNGECELAVRYSGDSNGRLYAEGKRQFACLPSPITEILFESWYRVFPQNFRVVFWREWGKKQGLPMNHATLVLETESLESIRNYYGFERLDSVTSLLHQVSALEEEPVDVLQRISPRQHQDTAHPLLQQYFDELKQIASKLRVDPFNFVLNLVESAVSILVLQYLIKSDFISNDEVGTYHFSYLHHELFIHPRTDIDTDGLSSKIQEYMQEFLWWDQLWTTEMITLPSSLTSEQIELLQRPTDRFDTNTLCEPLIKEKFPAFNTATHAYTAQQEGIDRMVLFVYLKETPTKPFFHFTAYYDHSRVSEHALRQEREDGEFRGRNIARKTFGEDCEVQFEHDDYGGLDVGTVMAGDEERVCTFVKAPPGSGKSIENLDKNVVPTVRQNSNVLSICVRNSLVADAKQKSMDADIETFDQTTTSKKVGAHHRVTTVESANKFVTTNYDSVFVDEASMVLCELSCDTFKGERERKVAINAIKDYIRSARNIIIACADLDRDAVELFKSWYNAGRLRYIYFSNSKQRLKLRIVQAKSDFWDRIVSSLFVEGVPVVVACSTKKGPESIVEMIKNKVCHNGFVTKLAKWKGCDVDDAGNQVATILNGLQTVQGGDDKTMVDRVIKNVTVVTRTKKDIVWEWMGDKQKLVAYNPTETMQFTSTCFAYSPVLGVGVDLMTEHFKHLYVYSEQVVGHLHSVLQLLRRFRKFQEALVYIDRLLPRVAERDLDNKMRAAENRINEFMKNGEQAVGLDEELEMLYKYSVKGLRHGKLTSDEFYKAALDSNPFNEMTVERSRHLYISGSDPELEQKVRKASKKNTLLADRTLTEKEIVQILDAKDLRNDEVEHSDDQFAKQKYYRLQLFLQGSYTRPTKGQKAYVISMYRELTFLREIEKDELSMTMIVSEMYSKESEQRKSDLRFMKEMVGFLSSELELFSGDILSYMRWCNTKSRPGKRKRTERRESDPSKVQKVGSMLMGRGYKPRKNKSSNDDWTVSVDNVIPVCFAAINKLLKKRAGSLKTTDKNSENRTKIQCGQHTFHISRPRFDDEKMEMLDKLLNRDFVGCPAYEFKGKNFHHAGDGRQQSTDAEQQSHVIPTILRRLQSLPT